MARLGEFHGKQVLRQEGIAVPRGEVVRDGAAARRAAERLGGPVVVKGQAQTTSRAGKGLIRFATTPDEAAVAAVAILGLNVANFPIDEVLVEEKLAIARECYAGIILDDTRCCPLLLVSSRGGSGLEEITKAHPEAVAELSLDVVEGLADHQAREVWRRVGVHGDEQRRLAAATVGLWQVARAVEARSIEINPLVVLTDGSVAALDCRITVDDAAVFRHPELGIDIARDLGHPATALERVAWAVERDDYRGTFYFLQMREGFAREDRVAAFHGAGGGGSMMAMDALQRHGFAIANFCDTSGNPPASKVYRAARVILSQGGVIGYFGSGSGVASQEQFHSARGLVKAFMEEPLAVPAVIRLGGNGEDKAIEILQDYTRSLGIPVECYGKDTSVDRCAERFAELVAAHTPVPPSAPRTHPVPVRPYTFATPTGEITFDHEVCGRCESKVCVVECVPQILKLDGDGLPVLAITADEARKGRCIECLACDVDCHAKGAGGGHASLPILELAAVRQARGVE